MGKSALLLALYVEVGGFGVDKVLCTICLVPMCVFGISPPLLQRIDKWQCSINLDKIA